MQSCGVQSQQKQLQNTPAPKALGTWQKRGWRGCKSQNIRGFSVRFCLLVELEATPMESYQHDFPKCEVDECDTNECAWLDRKEPTRRPQPYTKNYKQAREVGNGRVGLLQRKAIFWHQVVSPENVIQVALYRLNRLYSGIIGIYTCNNKSEQGYECERK